MNTIPLHVEHTVCPQPAKQDAQTGFLLHVVHCIMFEVPFVVLVQMQQSYVPSIVSISSSGSDFTGIARFRPTGATLTTIAAGTTVADGTLLRSCSVDSSSFARLKAVLAQLLLKASLHKRSCSWGHSCRLDSFAKLQRWQQLLRSTEGRSRPTPARSLNSENAVFFLSSSRDFSSCRATRQFLVNLRNFCY